ncbi:MAG: hydantoinase/oxoprolinase family protein [Thalassobaculum sp.]
MPADCCRSGRKARVRIRGPVCYGLGNTRPTVTDANLVLGRINADRPIGGKLDRLDVDAARARHQRPCRRCRWRLKASRRRPRRSSRSRMPRWPAPSASCPSSAAMIRRSSSPCLSAAAARSMPAP